MLKKIFLIIFILLCLIYLIDSILVYSIHSKRNILFILGVVFSALLCLFVKKTREILFIGIISIFLFDIFFNIFLQDKFSNIKVKPLFKNSIQLSADYLDDWPYFKLKPNIIARTYGDRGEDCVYEWKTDRLGFKNFEVKNEYDFVTLGNSYIEGMCVNIDETIAHYLNQDQISTYNLGVQGWSDRQAISSLKFLEEENITYKGVIFGYLADRFSREKNFLNKAEQKGGLGVIINNDLRNDKSYFVSRQIFQSIFSKNKFNWKKQFSEMNVNKIKDNYSYEINIKDKYKNLKLPLNYFPNPIPWSVEYGIDLNNNKLIDISNDSILDLAKKLEGQNKELIIFIFPLKNDVIGHIIYEDGYICGSDYYNAYLRIHNNLKNTNYVFIDFFDQAVELTKKFIDTKNYDYFIWKYKDPHYSKIGNKMVSNSIKDYINYGYKGSSKYLNRCN
jgi:hypothetical protein